MICPRFWVTGGVGDSHVSSVEGENSGQSPPLKNMVAQKANGHDFDELSTNVFCIYIYGQARQYTYLKIF